MVSTVRPRPIHVSALPGFGIEALRPKLTHGQRRTQCHGGQRMPWSEPWSTYVNLGETWGFTPGFTSICRISTCAQNGHGIHKKWQVVANLANLGRLRNNKSLPRKSAVKMLGHNTVKWLGSCFYWGCIMMYHIPSRQSSTLLIIDMSLFLSLPTPDIGNAQPRPCIASRWFSSAARWLLTMLDWRDRMVHGVYRLLYTVCCPQLTVLYCNRTYCFRSKL